MAESNKANEYVPDNGTSQQAFSHQMYVVGLNITRYRENKNIAKKDFAKLLGVALSTVRRYELGIYNIPFTRLTEIANVLNVSISDLTAEPDDSAEGYSECSKESM